jgi:hypothetical protein
MARRKDPVHLYYSHTFLGLGQEYYEAEVRNHSQLEGERKGRFAVEAALLALNLDIEIFFATANPKGYWDRVWVVVWLGRPPPKG